MSWKNKVIWFEGLFLRPHHFQQHDRYLEDYVEGRCRALHNHSWGFTELTLDKDQLSIGKVAVASAQGVFPDGTPFNIPEDDRPPEADVDIDGRSVWDVALGVGLVLAAHGITDATAELALARPETVPAVLSMPVLPLWTLLGLAERS